MSTAQEPAKLVETQIPSVDGYSLTRSTPAPQSASNTLTPEEIAREAYAAYMDARVDPETAFSRVQAKTAELLSDPDNIAAIVTADVKALNTAADQTSENVGTAGAVYALNTNSMHIHVPGCFTIAGVKQSNVQYTTHSYTELLAMGYLPCFTCLPE